MNKIFIAFFATLILIGGCTSTPMTVDTNNIANLTDEPAIRFNTSGWSYTNTTNPFLLTPDLLTNSLLAVSRLKPGQHFPNDGPAVPNKLNQNAITALLKNKLASKENLVVSIDTINEKSVVVATYSEDGKKVTEYATELNGDLIHVLFMAIPGQYYQQGIIVANRLVGSIEPITK